MNFAKNYNAFVHLGCLPKVVPGGGRLQQLCLRRGRKYLLPKSKEYLCLPSFHKSVMQIVFFQSVVYPPDPSKLRSKGTCTVGPRECPNFDWTNADAESAIADTCSSLIFNRIRTHLNATCLSFFSTVSFTLNGCEELLRRH